MSRHMDGEDKVYRAYLKYEYFSMVDDKPCTMQPGPYEYDQKSYAHGPYTSTAPARRQLKKELGGKPMTVEEGRKATERHNEEVKSWNTNPPQWARHQSPRELRDWYYYVTDFGIDYVEPADWKRLEGK